MASEVKTLLLKESFGELRSLARKASFLSSISLARKASFLSSIIVETEGQCRPIWTVRYDAQFHTRKISL